MKTTRWFAMLAVASAAPLVIAACQTEAPGDVTADPLPPVQVEPAYDRHSDCSCMMDGPGFPCNCTDWSCHGCCVKGVCLCDCRWGDCDTCHTKIPDPVCAVECPRQKHADLVNCVAKALAVYEITEDCVGCFSATAGLGLAVCAAICAIDASLINQAVDTCQQ
jgi:hypothetical protein